MIGAREAALLTEEHWRPAIKRMSNAKAELDRIKGSREGAENGYELRVIRSRADVGCSTGAEFAVSEPVMAHVKFRCTRGAVSSGHTPMWFPSTGHLAEVKRLLGGEGST